MASKSLRKNVKRKSCTTFTNWVKRCWLLTLFSGTLLRFKTTYILEAISTLRFMYCAKSLEFIGDCCDAAIFRILRSVTSLWNWLRNVMIHLSLVASAAKLNINFELYN